MFKELQILSQASAKTEAFKRPNYWNIVSISAPNEIVDFCGYEKSVCRVHFDDMDKPKEGQVLCTKEHINSVIKYSESIQNEPIMFHCHAGISRSPAMAFLVLLNYWKNKKIAYPVDIALETLIDFKNIHTIYPNRFVMNLGIEILAKDTDQLINWNRELYQSEIFRKIYNA